MYLPIRYRFIPISISQDFSYLGHLDCVQGFRLVLSLKTFVYGFEGSLHLGDVSQAGLVFVLGDEMIDYFLFDVLDLVFSEGEDCHEHLLFSCVFQVVLSIGFGYFCLDNLAYNLLIFGKFDSPSVIWIGPPQKLVLLLPTKL